MKKVLIPLSLAVAIVSAEAKQILVITQADKDRATEIVSQMTLQEKCMLVAGKKDRFFTYAVDRLGVPEVNMADGPQGVRNYGSQRVNSTYYPCGIAIASSFNREIAKGVGTGIGNDAKSRGVGIMLCPGVNIYRSPLCGRNFEYYGEDPYLASEMAVNYISGIQEQGVMSTIKHFALNNQEYDRHHVSSNVDLRTNIPVQASELKEYVKVKLNPGETGEVVLYLPESAFSYYDMTSHDWKVDHVNYKIQIGASATDIKLEKSLNF